MLNWFKTYMTTPARKKGDGADEKWRLLLKEVYSDLEAAKRERNALKQEVARLKAICDCQAELLAERRP